VTSYGIRVYPPGQTTSKVIPFSVRICSNGGMRVRAINTE
jgi:hypothetical protein